MRIERFVFMRKVACDEIIANGFFTRNPCGVLRRRRKPCAEVERRRAKLPAESFAAGANPVSKWGMPVQGNILDRQNEAEDVIRNINMARNCVQGNDEDKANESEKELPWIHSYFIENSLFDTKILYETLVEQIGSTKPQKPKEAK